MSAPTAAFSFGTPAPAPAAAPVATPSCLGISYDELFMKTTRTFDRFERTKSSIPPEVLEVLMSVPIHKLSLPYMRTAVTAVRNYRVERENILEKDKKKEKVLKKRREKYSKKMNECDQEINRIRKRRRLLSKK